MGKAKTLLGLNGPGFLHKWGSKCRTGSKERLDHSYQVSRAGKMAKNGDGRSRPVQDTSPD